MESDGGGGRISIATASKVTTTKARKFKEWNRRASIDQSVSSSDTAIVVSYFLPVIVNRSPQGRWSATWDDETLLSMQTSVRMTRIGTVRYPGGIPVDEEDAVAHALMELNCYPIFISQKNHFQFYEIYCKKILWPMINHVTDVYGQEVDNDSAQTQQDVWYIYTTVNRLFRDKIVEVYHRGNLIWIHGFHLMLLPTFVRRSINLAKIGLFFHTPFPSSEIWRTLDKREELLRGILGADHLGFHLYEYARHFLVCCHRLLGHNHEAKDGKISLDVDGREVTITCMHVGVDLAKVQEAIASPDYQQDVESWKTKFPNKVIFASVDRLERFVP
jgi:trehalose 6-phosphate synthase/phosphatase